MHLGILGYSMIVYCIFPDKCKIARKSRDAAAVVFVLKLADDIHYKFKSSQALFGSQASELQTYRQKRI